MEEKEKSREVVAGQKVPVLEHAGCKGIIGTVVMKNGPDIKVECDSCGRSVILDMRHG